MIKRRVTSVLNPRPQPGFLGKGHVAVPVLDGRTFAYTDPFIVLMDDQLDLPGEGVAGGPHPHAGFETVTLVLEGDPESHSKTMQTGGLEWMTAGSGIEHTEEIRAKVKMRFLQLWLVLPKERRWAEPKWQELHLDNVPIKRFGKSEIRVYSGSSMGLVAPTHNETPTTIVDFNLEPGYSVQQELSTTYNGFLYVVKGTVLVGDDETSVGEGQVAWLDRPTDKGESQVNLTGGSTGARFILYAGEPQLAQIVSKGPFIGDTQEDIVRLYREYRLGKMPHVRNLPASQVVRHV